MQSQAIIIIVVHIVFCLNFEGKKQMKLVLVLCSATFASAFMTHSLSHFPDRHCLRSRCIRSTMQFSGKSFVQAAECPSPKFELPKKFQALYAKRVGESVRDVAEIREISMDEILPKAGEVIVKVLFAGVNGGCETFRARGDHIFSKNRDARHGFPLGAEGSGIVVVIGEGVANVAVGDHVSFLGSAFAEYVRLRADGLIHVAEANAETAALRISAVTACGVLNTGQAKPGDVVLITAAAGGSGHFAVQLAKKAGCTVVGTCSSDAKARYATLNDCCFRSHKCRLGLEQFAVRARMRRDRQCGEKGSCGGCAAAAPGRSRPGPRPRWRPPAVGGPAVPQGGRPRRARRLHQVHPQRNTHTRVRA